MASPVLNHQPCLLIPVPASCQHHLLFSCLSSNLINSVIEILKVDNGFHSFFKRPITILASGSILIRGFSSVGYYSSKLSGGFTLCTTRGIQKTDLFSMKLLCSAGGDVHSEGACLSLNFSVSLLNSFILLSSLYSGKRQARGCCCSCTGLINQLFCLKIEVPLMSVVYRRS